jgi:hypothetical protein
MMRTLTTLLTTLTAGWLFAAPVSAADPVVPLTPEIAKDLEVLGKNVVGKALPAPPLDDIEKYLDIGPGKWTYEIVSGDEDTEIRVESYERIDSPEGHKAYKRTIGKKYIEYLQFDKDGHFGKYASDDLDSGYGSRMEPGILVQRGFKPGDAVEAEGKLAAYKLGTPNEIKFRGAMKSKLEYVGAYQVTTPAGSWPAILIRQEYDIKIGPAKASDVAYFFFVEGVGKVAAVETIRISALLIYHSSTKTAKVLVKEPEVQK